MSEQALDFSIYLIHSLARMWNKKPADVYHILNRTRILDDYILPCYDTLHTQGEKALVDDLSDYVREKGVVL